MKLMKMYLIGMTCLLSINLAHAKVTAPQEYKVLLKPVQFYGDRNQVNQQAALFLTDLQQALSQKGLQFEIAGTFTPEATRNVRYYDTENCSFNKQNTIVRERIMPTDQHELMLKLRNKDPQSLASVSLVGDNSNAKQKLEQDVTPTNRVYSLSAKQPISSDTQISVETLQTLYPNWQPQNSISQSQLHVVNNLMINETVYESVKITLHNRYKLSLTLWAIDDADKPVIAEVSFTNKSDLDDEALSLMQTINEMKDWAQTDSQTKTEFVYHYQNDFCPNE